MKRKGDRRRIPFLASNVSASRQAKEAQIIGLIPVVRPPVLPRSLFALEKQMRLRKQELCEVTVLATVVLIVLVGAAGCERQKNLAETRAKALDTANSGAQGLATSNEAPVESERMTFLLASDKNGVLCGEDVIIAELLYHPPTGVRPICWDHQLYQTWIPTKEELTEALIKSGGRHPVTFADRGEAVVGGYKPEFLGEVMRGWFDSGNLVSGGVAPGLRMKASRVQFKRPGTYLLESKWTVEQDGTEKKLRAFLLIWVKARADEPAPFSPLPWTVGDQAARALRLKMSEHQKDVRCPAPGTIDNRRGGKALPVQ
ncbi:MAG: hypothetical protein ABFC96_15680 [Thermoguttaceae bacterium]